MPRFVSDTRELSPEESIPPTSNPYAPISSPAERILESLCRAPVDKGRDQVARFMIESLAATFPAIAFAVSSPTSRPGEEFIGSREVDPHFTEAGGLRLFAGLAHERRLPIEDGCGTTLHCASNETEFDQDEAPLLRTIRLGVAAVGSALRTASIIEAARRRMRELQQVQASIIQTEKLASLGEISAGVVHELSNPLTSIVTYSEYLLRKAEQDGTDPQDVERLRRIGDSADRILKFARALVSYARPSEEAPSAVELREIIDKSLIFCEHTINESRVRVSLQIADGIPPVRGVSGQLIQVFVNLITNACQAMADSGGDLSIQACLPPPGMPVIITVSDTGPGIAEQNLPRVFDPFFTTKEHSKGTGLGLSVVRYIVVGHGGEVAAHSTRHGASFTVQLPAAALSTPCR
ncbi:MAG: two-component sensor histidine kinase [Deltaproteobacteria bacterium]|nr:two-component sensor histidine kinase [Deltaproteobacteria bacterium]